MRVLKSFILAAALQILTVTAGLAGDAGISELRVVLERDQVKFAEPQYRAYVSADSNKFAFRVPAGFRLMGDPASRTLTLANREGNGSVTFAIFAAAPVDPEAATPAILRESLLKENSTASVAQEFWRNNSSGGGPGFDLQWKAAGMLVECKRVVYMSSPAGILRFTATGSRTNIAALQGDLDSIIKSFQCTTNGAKPKVPPLLDRT